MTKFKTEAELEAQRLMGLRMRWARELVFPNQAELARIMGLTKGALNKHEAGTRMPPMFVLIEYATRCRMSLDYFLRGLIGDDAGKNDPELVGELVRLHPELLSARHRIGSIPKPPGKPGGKPKKPKKRAAGQNASP